MCYCGKRFPLQGVKLPRSATSRWSAFSANMNVEQNEEAVQLFHCSVWLSCQFKSAILHHSRPVKCKLAASDNLLRTSYPILCRLASLALISTNQVDLYENKFNIALNRRPKRFMQPVVSDSALIHRSYTTCATRRKSKFQNLYNLSFTSTRCKFHHGQKACWESWKCNADAPYPRLPWFKTICERGEAPQKGCQTSIKELCTA